MRGSFVLLVAAVALCVFSCASASPVILWKAPVYKQCDTRWAQNTMGTDNRTICQSGCAMSCVASAIAAAGITINGQTVDPASLNAWLVANGGYICIDNFCSNLNLTRVDDVAPGRIMWLGEPFKPSFKELVFAASNNILFILHVRNKSHFVALVGYDSQLDGTLYVMDPYYSVDSYSYDDVADVLIYRIA
jgi:hypothetical protein